MGSYSELIFFGTDLTSNINAEIQSCCKSNGQVSCSGAGYLVCENTVSSMQASLALGACLNKLKFSRTPHLTIVHQRFEGTVAKYCKNLGGEIEPEENNLDIENPGFEGQKLKNTRELTGSNADLKLEKPALKKRADNDLIYWSEATISDPEYKSEVQSCCRQYGTVVCANDLSVVCDFDTNSQDDDYFDCVYQVDSAARVEGYLGARVDKWPVRRCCLVTKTSCPAGIETSSVVTPGPQPTPTNAPNYYELAMFPESTTNQQNAGSCCKKHGTIRCEAPTYVLCDFKYTENFDKWEACVKKHVSTQDFSRYKAAPGFDLPMSTCSKLNPSRGLPSSSSTRATSSSTVSNAPTSTSAGSDTSKRRFVKAEFPPSTDQNQGSEVGNCCRNNGGQVICQGAKSVVCYFARGRAEDGFKTCAYNKSPPLTKPTYREVPVKEANCDAPSSTTSWQTAATGLFLKADYSTSSDQNQAPEVGNCCRNNGGQVICQGPKAVVCYFEKRNDSAFRDCATDKSPPLSQPDYYQISSKDANCDRGL